MPRFTHLHVASAYSAHFGTSQPEALVASAVSDGAEVAAITDRDGLYGAIRHVRACIAAGIDAVVGVDLALLPERSARASTPGRQADSPAPPSSTPARITVLAHGHNSGEGWAALCRLISAAHSPAGDGMPRRPNDVGIQRSRPSGFLIGESGPVATVLLGPDSDVAQAVAAADLSLAASMLAEWKRLLPGAIAVEVVCHLTEPGERASIRHAARMLELADSVGVPAVLSNAVRYLRPDDAVTGDVLDAADRLRPLGAFQPQPNAQAWLKSADAMRRLAFLIVDHSALPRSAAEQLLSSTERLADTCRLDPREDLAWRRPKLPSQTVLGIEGDPLVELRRRSESGLLERYADARSSEVESLKTRLDTEIDTIGRFGFASYFLTVAEVSSLMRSMNVRNQARGSGAGSLVNYALRISNVDPIRHDLLFERFLGNKRSTLPDIDIDVESARRHDIYRAIFERFGQNRVSLMSMQNTYRARGAARDAGLALGLDDAQIDLVATNLWRFNARDFRQVLDEKPELREIAALVKNDAQIDMLVDLTERLDRLPRHISMHPCGVILGNDELLNTTPVQPSGMGLPMSQYDKHDMDDAGLLKLDVLGVRMQSTLAYAVSEIHRVHGRRTAHAGGLPVDARYVSADGIIELDEIPLDDEATFEAIRTTRTLGMFQIESPGQRELIGKMQPTEFEDLIADISLFRPGPMKGNMVAPFLDTKHGFAQPQYLHPTFRPFLESTYGVVIYHEQILRIFAACMNVSLAEGDEMRRTIDDPDARVEERFRQQTAANVDSDGARIYDDRAIERIWAVLKGFGSFGFCKAHGAAFALPTFQSAWLKTHYPAEFVAALLTHDPGMYPKRLLLAEARRMGVPILPLDVSASREVYTVERIEPPRSHGVLADPDDVILGIRLSLSDVHGITAAELERILENQPYVGIGDFYQRAAPSRALLTRLGLVGALDSLAAPGEAVGDAAASRGDVMARVRELIARGKRPATRHIQPTLPIFVDDREQLTELAEPPSMIERVATELDVLQMEISEHVIESYRPLLDELGVLPASELLNCWNGTTVLVAGIRVATQTPPMRSGKRVVFISLDDGSGCSDSTFFEEAQDRAGPLLFGTKLMVIQGKTRRTGERGISIEASNAWDLKALWAQWQQTQQRQAREAS
ncbi:DNA polymerase III subunit alpha [Agreia sp. Leaf335]|uniref:DNA polymerase III subunit alpha n=1 Tax=Agreia sp. Leaf335 TaxID=1736340 RepID=UPI0006FCD1F5|nr:DNA polymerase III subunit alpha [Agreia sp. Leaf335]KQR24622.1 DNA polymerase III subunit alpha [Agreia sp. Leaf335]